MSHSKSGSTKVVINSSFIQTKRINFELFEIPVSPLELESSMSYSVYLKERDNAETTFCYLVDAVAAWYGYWGKPVVTAVEPVDTLDRQLFNKSEQELQAYEMPITKILEMQAIKDMTEIDNNLLLKKVLSSSFVDEKKEMKSFSRPRRGGKKR